MALSDTTARTAKPREKPYKLTDEKGMHLLVTPTGGKWWRLAYRYQGKQKLLSLGVYPDVGLAVARERREAARKLLANGTDPSAARKEEKAAEKAKTENTFEAVAREWHGKHAPNWHPRTASTILRRLEVDIFPLVGALPVGEVKAPDILMAVRRLEARGVLESAHRIKQVCGQVLRYAVATGRAERDPSADLRGALPPVRPKHHASITDPKRLGALLRAIADYEGAVVTRCALRLAALTFVRPGELRGARWAELDLAAAEWRIPGERMKMKTTHIVPLSRQALQVFLELHPLTGTDYFVFPSLRTGERCMSENTVNGALRRLGYTKEEMTGHGFRSIASTLLNEQGWHPDAIERQLAHAERDGVRAAYNYAEHLPERRKMMQGWADYLDRLRDGAELIPFPTRATT